MSGFSTINTAVTGLTAAQRALDATSQNIVNANTPGYSRQRVVVESVNGSASAALFTGQNAAVIGGARVAEVTRIRDAFLEATRAAAGARQSNITTQTDVLTAAQQLLSEPGETGLQNTLDSFYASWHDLSNNPTDTAAGSVVIQRGLAVRDSLRSVREGLDAQWQTSYSNLVDVVAQINQSGDDLAKLNVSIRAGESAGQPVNELRDTRDLLVRKLAQLTGATSSQDDSGQLSVSINGINIVAGNTFTPVTIAGAHDLASATANPPRLQVGGHDVPVESGTAAGLIAAMGTDLPTLADKVDGVTKALVTAVNQIYTTGFAQDGSTGAAFFAGTDAMTLEVVPVTAAELTISGTAGKVDGSVARRIGDLTDDAVSATALGGPGASAQWRVLTTSLGVQVQSLQTAKNVQDAVVTAAEDAVQSDAGVNLDEEMTNMLLFQRAYQASARVVTTADELLDTLINRTGRTGL